MDPQVPGWEAVDLGLELGWQGVDPRPPWLYRLSLEGGASRHVRSPGSGGGHAAGGGWGGENGAGHPREGRGSRRQRPRWIGAQTD